MQFAQTAITAATVNGNANDRGRHQYFVIGFQDTFTILIFDSVFQGLKNNKYIQFLINRRLT